MAAAVTPSESESTFDEISLDLLKYGKYYNAFFASGLAALIVLIGLMVFIGLKKYQRTNPIGIMFNLLFVQVMLTGRIFIVGLFFQIW